MNKIRKLSLSLYIDIYRTISANICNPLFLSSFAGICSSRHQHGYLTNYYNAHRPIVVNDSMILELTNRFLTDDPTDNFISCNVMVTTTTGRRIAMHFLSLEISNNDKTVDRLYHSILNNPETAIGTSDILFDFKQYFYITTRKNIFYKQNCF